MIIRLQISEPWELPAELPPVIELIVEESQANDDRWLVRLDSGPAYAEEAVLTPRYEGETLDVLRRGQVQVVNLLVRYRSNGQDSRREMLVGTARVLQDQH
jgi:hypothetical protein